MLHADSAAISSTDMKIWDVKSRIGTTGSGGSVLRQCGIFLSIAKLMLLVLGMMLTIDLMATPIIPRESKVLGMTKGKKIRDGLVFIDGKFINPPYVVERWGVGIRINGKPVIGQVLEWNAFLKTQAGLKVTKSEVPMAAPMPEPAQEPEPAPTTETNAEADADDDSSLDDLFDDNPKPKKKTAKNGADKKAATPAQPKTPQVVVSYSLEGDFVPNETTQMMVKRINKMRQEIDVQLRLGGFICFGDNYARVSGDHRTAMQLLEKVPELQQHSENIRDFVSGVRSAGLLYLSEMVCNDLFRNRTDYRSLQELRSKWRKDLEFKKLVGE